LLVGIEQLTPRTPQMPFHMVGEHAKEEVRSHMILVTQVDGADMEVNGLQTTKTLFNLS
jgi:hypothetical protein